MIREPDGTTMSRVEPARASEDREPGQTSWSGIPAVHRLLDPRLPRTDRSAVRFWRTLERRLARGELEEHDLFTRLPSDGPSAEREVAAFASCLADADAYLDDLLEFVPRDLAVELAVGPRVRAMRDARKLLGACFRRGSARLRFEAQRKLYLAKLLFAIDHSRSVRDGRRHLDLLAEHVEGALFDGAASGGGVDVCCRLVPGGPAAGSLQRIDVSVADARCWHFQVRVLPARAGEEPIEIFHHHVRFKRDSMTCAPHQMPSRGSDAEVPGRFAGRRRSGSILSKMLARGIAEPSAVQDMLGALFIVGSQAQAYALERRLVDLCGGPLWIRDRTDTLAGERDRSLLSDRSARGFEVLKYTADLLVSDAAERGSYHVAVEFQIYPVESYLATLHDDHGASHRAYKRRQIAGDVLPLLFPAAIYGRAAVVDSPVTPTGRAS